MTKTKTKQSIQDCLTNTRSPELDKLLSRRVMISGKDDQLKGRNIILAEQLDKIVVEKILSQTQYQNLCELLPNRANVYLKDECPFASEISPSLFSPKQVTDELSLSSNSSSSSSTQSRHTGFTPYEYKSNCAITYHEHIENLKNNPAETIDNKDGTSEIHIGPGAFKYGEPYLQLVIEHEIEHARMNKSRLFRGEGDSELNEFMARCKEVEISKKVLKSSRDWETKDCEARLAEQLLAVNKLMKLDQIQDKYWIAFNIHGSDQKSAVDHAYSILAKHFGCEENPVLIDELAMKRTENKLDMFQARNLGELK